ncbi:hypothetical protein HII31_08293 [Pseudocercospora fuligena]|uniref:RING-type domain-containing protein n=1 Tax=Pseudocercospora fuligena TaxID=685502 RepID=A0A8H6VGA8_9PEZI|nr:hypothetical protein HII31_08293 [Pseudocercospora fuligena]
MLPTREFFYANGSLTSVPSPLDRRCGICLDKPEEIIDPVTIPCSCIAIYCRESITIWLNSSGRCPICRKLFFIPPEVPEDMREYLEIYGVEAFGEELVEVEGSPPGYHEFLRYEHLVRNLAGMTTIVEDDDSVLYEDRRWATFDYRILRLILLGRANELAYFQVLDGQQIQGEEMVLFRAVGTALCNILQDLDGSDMLSRDVVDHITTALLDELDEQHVDAICAARENGDVDESHWLNQILLYISATASITADHLAGQAAGDPAGK